MKLLVIGSAGGTGRHVVEQGLGRGHAVVAFTRRPQELVGVNGLAGIVRGDAQNIDNLRHALRDQDAVISTIGSSAIVSNLIQAMIETGVRRLVITSSRSVVATRPRIPIAIAWLLMWEIYADLARGEGMIEVSGLDWTIVRGSKLTNGEFTKRVHTDFEPNPTGGRLTLARANFAMAILDAAERQELVGKFIGVGDAW